MDWIYAEYFFSLFHKVVLLVCHATCRPPPYLISSTYSFIIPFLIFSGKAHETKIITTDRTGQARTERSSGLTKQVLAGWLDLTLFLTLYHPPSHPLCSLSSEGF